MKTVRICFFAAVTIACLPVVFGQYSLYNREYFMFPIKPGQRNFLSGNMGELRPNHFHGGLDVKTEQKTGLPVHAAADGYVSRIAVKNSGYGNTLYITHPNGLTTVYAHLEWFEGEISKFIKKYLYDNQCNMVDLPLQAGVLTVTKGQVIALSGNSGSSGGPHLHWEIRDENEHLLNPLFFKFDEIADNLPPIINRFALRTFDINARIEGEFGRYEYVPVKTLNKYALKYPIHVNGWVGIELNTYDKMDDAPTNLYGVSLIEVFLDGRKIFTHDIQRISFDENPHINAHVDFSTLKASGSYFQKCYVDDGNELKTYGVPQGSGKIYIADTAMHEVFIKVTDAYRNSTTLTFTLKGTKHYAEKKLTKPEKTVVNIKPVEYENILKIECTGIAANEALIYMGTRRAMLPLAYKAYSTHVFLWDLRQGLPDSVKIGNHTQRFNYKELIPPGVAYTFSNPKMDIYFAPKSLFDTLYLSTGYFNDVYSVKNMLTPLQSPITITLKPDAVPEKKDKTSAYLLDHKKRTKHAGGVWQGHQLQFNTKVFGDFKLLADTTAPKIVFHKAVGQVKYFKIYDNLSGVSNWWAYLNGQFLLTHYDSKYNVLFTDLPDHLSEIKGKLEIGIVDNVKNEANYTFTFP